MTQCLAKLQTLPVSPLSADAAAEALELLFELGEEQADLAAFAAEESKARDFLCAAFSLSPWLSDTARVDPDALVDILFTPLGALLEDVEAEMREAWRDGDGPVAEGALMATLRRAKRRAAMALALHDLARLIDAKTTTAGLTGLADAALSGAVDHLLRAAHDGGKLKLADPDRPSHRSGVVVLGMGKHGAGELNFSSDIDIVVFFEPEAEIAVDPEEATDTFARLVRRLVRIMQERTAEGYVFRTDLRLRPDPGSTPLAFPVDAAMNYYESRGQNWERAAYIKARPVAGDIQAGERFIAEMAPFVFRKYLDYAAIADIHSIKRQIHSHRGFGEIAVRGHNVKLGRGGIREIEFFVQTQQLIAGGRMPALRGRRTDDMLACLAEAHWIDPATAEKLTAAYWYLRDVEHRIQMMRDEQSHTLPEDEDELRRVALMTGETDITSFGAALTARLKTVETIYAGLFEKEERLSGEAGNLVFTGEDDDPGTLETLSRLGFERPTDVSRIIRTWHYGRYRATRSAEAREQLTELTPRLLEVFGATRRADEAIVRFDEFLAGLPAGIQFFSLIGNNPGLLSFLVTVMTAAPRLAELIARRPHVFDGMLDPTLMAELPTRAYLEERLDAALAGSSSYEETLDRLRIVAQEQKFLIGVRLLTGAISAARAGEAFTDLADLIIAVALDAVKMELEEAHGQVPGGRVVVLGMGKLGSRELSAGSDVDIILLYDCDPDLPDSDGAKPLDAVRYYTRFTQRLVAALSAPMAEGVLYEVDLRLRPSGNKGPVATSIRAFGKYQAEDAWTWEHMALTRARVVTGDEDLADAVRATIDDVLGKKRDRGALLKDLREMRDLIETEKPPKDHWDVKLIRGGLIDIEFIAQYLSLMARAGGWKPGEALTGTVEVLEALGPDAIGRDAVEKLTTAHGLWTGQTQILRLCVGGVFDPDDAPPGLGDLLIRAADAPDIRALEADMKTTARDVRALFDEITRISPSSSKARGKGA